MNEKFNSYLTDLAKSLSEKIPEVKKRFRDYMPVPALNSFVLLPSSP